MSISQMLNHIVFTCKHSITPRNFAIDGPPELMHRFAVVVEAMLGSESSCAGVATAGNTKSLSITSACVRATMKRHVVSIRTKGGPGVCREKENEEGTLNLRYNSRHSKFGLEERTDSRAQRAH